MSRIRIALVIAALLMLPSAAFANPIRKVWIAFDQGNAGCKSTLDDYLGCLFDRSNYRALLNSYPGGFDYVVGETKVIPGCALGDYTCVQTQAQFPVSTDDILLHVHAGNYCNQAHNERGNTIVFNGKTISVRTGWIDATSCKCQMPFIEHEVYEAANDQASADCCNGQGWINQQCCNYFGGDCKNGCCGSVASNGWYDTMACPNGTYRAQYLAASPFIADPSKCAKLEVGCPGGGSGKVLHAKCTNAAECCKGLSCDKWVYDNSMQPEAVCCSGAGAGCKVGTDCCGTLACKNGTCTCMPEASDCLNDGDCCDGLLCGSGKCIKKPAPPIDASVSDASGDGSARDPDATADGGEGGLAEDPVIEVPGCTCRQAVTPRATSSPLAMSVGAVALIAWRRRRRSDEQLAGRQRCIVTPS